MALRPLGGSFMITREERKMEVGIWRMEVKGVSF